MVSKKNLEKEYYRSGEVAKLIGVTTRTIQNYCIRGDLDEIIINGRRLIPKDSILMLLDRIGVFSDTSDDRYDVIYARVSTHKQKNRGDLERQIEKVKCYAVHCEPKNLLVIQDVGSGLNDNRKGLIKLLKMVQNNEVKRIFINYKDRLTRFGFNYIKLICEHNNTELVIVSKECDDKTVSEELAEDIISIIHSFSGKLYGMRRKVRDTLDKELISNDNDTDS